MSKKKPRPKLPEGMFHVVLPRGAYGVYVPDNYEPNYAYPVLVLMHGRGKSEKHMLRLGPKISRRNYVAVALRGPDRIGVRRTGKPAFSWTQYARRELDFTRWGRIERKLLSACRDCWYLHDYVREVLGRLGEELSLDMRRVYLIGHGEGGAAALRLALGIPAYYAGVAVLNGWLPAVRDGWIRWPEVRRLRALVVHGRSNRRVPVEESRAVARLLYAAGLDVTYAALDGRHGISRAMLRTLDDWLMGGCSSAV